MSSNEASKDNEEKRAPYSMKEIAAGTAIMSFLRKHGSEATSPKAQNCNLCYTTTKDDSVWWTSGACLDVFHKTCIEEYLFQGAVCCPECTVPYV